MLPVSITRKKGNRRSRYKRSKFSLKKCVLYLSLCGFMYLCVVWMFLVVLRSPNDVNVDVDVEGMLYGPGSLRQNIVSSTDIPLIEKKNWCLETNDEYSMKDPPLLMGLGWGMLPKSKQRRWKQFKCNHIIDWTSSKEDPLVWCNAVYSHSMNNDVRRKYDIMRCNDFIQRDRENGDVTTSGGRTFYTSQDCDGKSCVYGPSKWEGSVLFDPKHMCVQTYESPMKELLLRTKDVNGEDKDVARAIEIHQNAHPNWSAPKFWEPQRNPNPLTGAETKPNVWFNTLHMMYNRFMMSHIKAEDVRQLLQFSNQVKETSIYKSLYEIRGTYDVAHVRRGDITTREITKEDGSCTLCIVSLESYKREMRKVGVDPDNVIWISNDRTIETPQSWHDDLRLQAENRRTVYPVGSSQIPKYVFQFLPDFLLIYFARRIFRAPSSFSFWAAFMNDQPNKVVYSPNMHKCKKSETQKPNQPQEYDCEFSQHNRNAWMTRPTPGKVGGTWSDIIFA